MIVLVDVTERRDRSGREWGQLKPSLRRPYGYRRFTRQLHRWDVCADPEVVRRCMRELGLVACQPPPWRPTTTQPGGTAPIPDLVRRDFSSEVPGQKMVGDITYIPTWEGWAYLATVIDCATRKVIGWAVDDHYRTPLITTAIEMAARNVTLPDDAVFHSDRGSNYTSTEFAAVLSRLGIRQSVGRTGSCFDNALAESFNAAVKVERVLTRLSRGGPARRALGLDEPIRRRRQRGVRRVLGQPTGQLRHLPGQRLQPPRLLGDHRGLLSHHDEQLLPRQLLHPGHTMRIGKSSS